MMAQTTETDSKIFNYIDQNQDYFVSRLAEVVAIKSVSGDVEHRPEVVKMGHWLKNELEVLGARFLS